MELANIESSRIIHLTTDHRPEGQVYMPDFLREVVGRYSFVKYPTIEELLKNEIKLSVGKFQNVQIQDLSIYGDGVIVSSSSDTDILAAFLDDLFSWIKDSFGMVPTLGSTPETYFESTVIVRADVDIVKAITPRSDIAAIVNRAFGQASSMEGGFVSSGFSFDNDVHTFAGRRRPLQFAVERRLGAPFENNIFHCRAPLPTKAHLAALLLIEEVARG